MNEKREVAEISGRTSGLLLTDRKEGDRGSRRFSSGDRVKERISTY